MAGSQKELPQKRVISEAEWQAHLLQLDHDMDERTAKFLQKKRDAEMAEKGIEPKRFRSEGEWGAHLLRLVNEMNKRTENFLQRKLDAKMAEKGLVPAHIKLFSRLLYVTPEQKIRIVQLFQNTFGHEGYVKEDIFGHEGYVKEKSKLLFAKELEKIVGKKILYDEYLIMLDKGKSSNP